MIGEMGGGEPLKFVDVAEFETCNMFRYLSCHSGNYIVVRNQFDNSTRPLYDWSNTLRPWKDSHLKIPTEYICTEYSVGRAEVSMRLGYAFVINIIIINIIIWGRVYIRRVGAWHGIIEFGK